MTTLAVAAPFEFVDVTGAELPLREETEPLVLGVHGTALLLRTSGTTSRPKGVPLKQGQVLRNADILAKSVGISSSSSSSTTLF